MDDRDIVYVDSHKVHCEGLKDAIGHPLVYLEIKNKQIECPYCCKIFKLRK